MLLYPALLLCSIFKSTHDSSCSYSFHYVHSHLAFALFLLGWRLRQLATLKHLNKLRCDLPQRPEAQRKGGLYGSPELTYVKGFNRNMRRYGALKPLRFRGWFKQRSPSARASLYFGRGPLTLVSSLLLAPTGTSLHYVPFLPPPR
jgi:hypothetical protein